jgi:hypothetical protein
MSIMQEHSLTHIVQKKLVIEAFRPDPRLRLLVGHANLLNLLTIESTEAKQTQWFDCLICGLEPVEEFSRQTQPRKEDPRSLDSTLQHQKTLH